MGAIHEAHGGFERDAHLEASRASLLAAGLDTRIASDRCGDGVSHLAGQLVHDRIHANLQSTTSPVRYEASINTSHDDVRFVASGALGSCRDMRFKTTYPKELPQF